MHLTRSGCFLAFTAVSLLTAAAFPVAAQYPGGGYPGGGYPGQYPPGVGYPGQYPGTGQTGPGLPFPRRGKKKKTDSSTDTAQQHLETLTGVLRTIDEKSITLTAQDTRTVTAKLSAKTEFYKEGKSSTAKEFKPGDHIHLDAKQDEEGFFYAVSVYLDTPGTPQERAAAERGAAPSTQRPSSDEDEDRPILRRKGTAAEPSTAAPEPPETAENDSGHRERSPQTVRTTEEDPNRPVLRRGSTSAKHDAKTAPSTSRPDPRSEDGWSTDPSYTAATRREPAAAEGGGWTTDPSYAAAGKPTDARIEKTRSAVETYTESLPNYYCQEQIARYVNTSRPVDWHALDIVSAALVYDKGREQYRNLAINGKPVNKKMEELSGSWSTGEFGTLMADLFQPGTAADFRFSKTATVAGHEAWLYDFSVEQPNSHWRILVAGQSVQPAYKGSVWIDSHTAQVLRIEMQAYHIPREFPVDHIESAVDYQYVRLGEHEFLLPVDAETLMCQRGSDNCSRNVINFRNYHKYIGESTITF